MKESDLKNSSLESAQPEGLIKNSPAPDAQAELIKMINQFLKLESITKDRQITSLEKEIIRLEKENSLLKKNFEKFYKLLFQLLRKTGIDENLYNALRTQKAGIFAENTLPINENKDFPFSDKKEGALDETTGDSYETTRDSDEATRSSHEKTRALDETASASDETTRGSNEKMKVLDETTKGSYETTKDSHETTNGSYEKTRGSNETTNASDEKAKDSVERGKTLDENPQGFGLRVPASSQKTKTSAGKTPASLLPGNALEMNTETKILSGRIIDLNTITQDMLNRNSRHRTLFIDGKNRIIANKNERHVAELVHQALYKFTKLPGYNDQQNLNIAYTITLKMGHEFSGRRFEVMTYVTLARMLLYMYCKKKFIQRGLCGDLNYSKAHFYRMMDLIKEKQWVEAYNLKQSDAFYISEKGKQYVESVLDEI